LNSLAASDRLLTKGPVLGCPTTK